MKSREGRIRQSLGSIFLTELPEISDPRLLPDRLAVCREVDLELDRIRADHRWHKLDLRFLLTEILDEPIPDRLLRVVELLKKRK